MKFKKGVLFTVFLFIAIIITSLFSKVSAATGSKYLNIKFLRNSGYGYQLGNSTKNIWKIYERGTNADDTIYCLKGGPGFGSSDFSTGGSPKETHYTAYFNLKDPNNIPATYKNALPDVNSKNYQALLWILDNCYVAPKQNASSDAKAKASINRQNLLSAAAQYAENEGNPDVSGDEFDYLTDDDIDAVQQLAVWYYTNPTGSYHVNGSFEFWLNSVKNTEGNMAALSNTVKFEDGYERAVACQALFAYLVQTPQASNFSYSAEESNASSSKPVKISNTTVTVETVNNRYIIGPYKLEKLTNTEYILNATFKDGNNNTISDVKLLNKDKQAVQSGKTVKDLVGQNFYISIPATTNISKVDFNISGSYNTTTATYWSVENPTQNDQPVVIVEKETKTFTDTKQFEYTEEPEEYFDLALRKFIISINGVAPEADRTPVISNAELQKLANGETTANKVHPKNALVVKTGDKVIYRIRVYNEGDIDGYATEVTDHLPAGLKFVTDSTINQQYGWTNPSGDGKTIKTQYLQNKLIKAFDGTNLKYEDLEIECEVIATVKTDNQTLKNIAEITAHKDKDGNTNVVDRDSQPNNVNITNYGNSSQQDDDDFENLVMLGQYFDLSLRKFITSVSNENGTRTFERVPNVNVSKLKNGEATTAIYNHPKTPVTVNNNDEVIYTIRVYNEGQIDGYVTEITDHLPPQLEFIVGDELNTKYGWTVSEDGRTVKTTITSPNSTNANSVYGDRTSDEKKVLLKAFDGTTLDYIDVQIKCRVKVDVTLEEKITNIAEITGFTDGQGNTVTDRDSQANNVVLPTDATLPTYRDTEINRGDAYIPGQQDDDDFEKIISRKKYFDLALRKFIISINGVAPEADRTPAISNAELQKLANGETTAEKVHPKNALTVKTGDKVIYKIRVYNEGDIDGYATEVTDHLPAGLKFVTDSTINQHYGWTNPSGDGKTIKTQYLQDKLIKAFDGTTLKYEDLEVECEVTAKVTTNDQILKNIAEITAHKDKDGNTNVVDRDSQPNNVNITNYGNSSQQDDDDFEDLVILGQYFDLSLRKFIVSVSNQDGTKDYNRVPDVDVTKLKNGEATTAIYNHDKTPVSVYNNDEVLYTIRVYNEGQIDGYVTEITDHLPSQLEFIVNDDLNIKYGWRVSEDGRTVTTDITSSTTENSATRDMIYDARTSNTDKVLLKAFDGTTLDYIDVQIKCRVKENINLFEKMTNIADITGFTDSDGDAITDRDSQEKNVELPTDADLPTYRDTEINRGDTYIPGQQDDDDFEKLVLQRFDLALRKFITGVNDKEITNRAPVFTKTEDNKYTYVHPKNPVDVATDNIVIYTLRIFNEGNMAGYASVVKDDLPEGLEFLPDNVINTAFKWKMYKEDGTEIDDVKEAEYIETDFLSKENEEADGDNLINAFDPSTMTMPDYKDLKIAFRVTEPNTSDRIIINTAEITDDSDEEGNPIDDVDSTPDNNKEGEDDIDIEKIKVKYFDLSLKKWVTESIVTYNGKTKVTKTGHTENDNPEAPAKVEIASDKLDKTIVKFKFKIKVTNEGEIAGYAKEVIDYIPKGLKFVAADNKKWREEDGKVLTDQLKDTLLQPGESATVEIILTWENNKNNMGLKTNWAEIYKDENEYNAPDIDSTPGNNTKGEDDIDDAPVILSTATGSAPTYITLALAAISIIAGGVVLIKKFVI